MAVPQPNIQPLKVGDSVPNILLTHMGNYKSNTLSLHDFKDRLVILDFWSTWCSACMDAMPHMQTLQSQFNNQMQILLVNTFDGDSLPKVISVFKKRETRTGNKVTLPYSLMQTKLLEYFPHRFVPHYVWILNGRMVAATSKDEVTAQNISAVLDGRPVSMHIKQDAIGFDASKPFLVDGNGGDGSDFISRSIITGYIEGIGSSSGTGRDADGKVRRFYMYNHPPRSMLRAAYPTEMQLPNSRILLESLDSVKFSDPIAGDTSRYLNSYCYELKVPACNDSLLRQYMREDFFRLFRVRVKTERRTLHCLMLKSRPCASTQKEPRPVPDGYSSPKNMKALIALLNSMPASTGNPVVDETGLKAVLDFTVPPSFSNVREIQSFLKAQGFEITLEDRDTEVTIISGG